MAGKTFSFTRGNIQIMYIEDEELVEELSRHRSLDLRKQFYMHKDRGPLLGNGLLTTNKEVWAHQRKITPTFHVDEVKVYIYI